MTQLPHFDTRNGFQLDATGKPLVCEQNSDAEIASAVTNYLVCLQGMCSYDPAFGSPAMVGDDQPIDLLPLTAGIQKYEPRVTSIATQTPDGLVSQVARQLAQAGITQVTITSTANVDTTP